MAIFKGSGVAIVTPFKPDGEVNYEEFGRQIDFQINNGTDAIIVCGTTGESACLSEEEHLRVIDFCVKHVNHRVPVVAGTGSNCTDTAVYLSQESEKIGADGLLIVTPYYNKATQHGLIDHFTIIANAVHIPIILYSVKSRTGLNINPETVAHLVKNVPNIVGVKEASGDIAQVARIMALTDGNIDLYSGNDNEVIPVMSLGGLGVISVAANVAPSYMHNMCLNFLNGDVAEARRMQIKLIDLVDALFCEVNPIPVKHAMNIMGMNAGPMRRPLSPMEPDNLERLKKSMRNFGLIQ
ncbi:MAG: 4-hydroxy-tetrahydrodipicolinate synthase [Lachnospiraceae bacterium]|nr:4-hydroxy-tetrahydrodipicolinate synthase [Lachnospiraceae bacterium]MBQ9606334.1 4-hydroxy-tetrahydrodipicolinate synthase [Lachnospiraceae bacterium]MBR1523711.1 4-hydroxy-tetrahydrodipicolinate synthase [Lachnospiraceae bacterium]